MNRLVRKPFKSVTNGKNALRGGKGALRGGKGALASSKTQTSQSFQEMIQWRREREKKERLDRNKVSLYYTIILFLPSFSMI